MKDLFDASQAQQVKSSRLLITHFASVRKYPEPHIEGIIDSIKELMRDSFLGLQMIGFKIAKQHLEKFEHRLSETFSGQPNAPKSVPQPALIGSNIFMALPDLLVPDLEVVFCGTAVGNMSAKMGMYYAGDLPPSLVPTVG